MSLPMLPPSAMVPKSTLVDQGVDLPPNIASSFPSELLQKIMRDILEEYIFPQTMERQAFEPMWDTLLRMYRMKLQREELRVKPDTKFETRMEDTLKGSNADRSQVSDSLVYDAVDRLKNLNHFISWKDGSPVQYTSSPFFKSKTEDQFYHPLADKIDSANGLLRWNISQNDIYRKHLIVAHHHYLYGCGFVVSDFNYETKEVAKRVNNQIIQEEQIAKIGVSFEPISIRKLWLNYRISAYDMQKQPCPFFFEEMPRFAIMQNQYDPQKNPFGFVNLDKLKPGQWMFSQQEMESLRTAIQERYIGMKSEIPAELIKPEYSVEALWTCYPMIALDSQTGEYKMRQDGITPIPLQRYILQFFGSDLRAGYLYPIRLQKNFYPQDALPLYGSTHMPDLDTGAYGLSIGEVLYNHYAEICTAMNQWIDNKNLINDPPSWFTVGSPAARMERNAPGADIPVNGPNDIGWKQVYDASNSTVQMLQYLRDGAQTTSKAVDAILGKALGGRTSATEAQNVFQAAMSGVTTDINLFNFDIMGSYADRVWSYCGLWFDEDLLKKITGMYGTPLTIEDLNTRVELKWDVGSTYIESIVKQGHLRYAIEAATRSPVLRQDLLWKRFFKELRMPEMQECVIDNNFTSEVTESTEQAIETYLGRQVIIDPTQDHSVAIEVKTRFIKDAKSSWNQQFRDEVAPVPNIMSGQPQTRGDYLIAQIQLHQQFALMQMQVQAAQMQEQMMMQQQMNSSPSESTQGLPSLQNMNVPTNAGQMVQQGMQP